jgi:hypothetical protein
MSGPFSPAGGRVGGSAVDAVAVHQSYPPSHPPRGDVVVRVVDTGILTHPWLAGHHVEYGESDIDPIPTSGMLARFAGHGTFVTGLILREAPGATVRMTRTPKWDDAVVSNAIAAAIGDGEEPMLLNLSFGGAASEGRRDVPRNIQTELQRLNEHSVVVVSAGNDASSDVHYPGGLDDVVPAKIVTVGAVDETLAAAAGAPPEVAGFSNHGDWVGCYASGVQVLGPYCYHQETPQPDIPRVAQDFRGWALWSGTSFAAATVTGRIARVAMDRRVSLMEAAQLVVDAAEQIPVLTDKTPVRAGEKVEWRPYVRGVASTWGEITLGAKEEPS